jgi:2'-deoxynucleoside 5'-phosphate N-hydrolase
MKIYFAGSIRGGRDDKDLYAQIIQKLESYGTVLTEHIGDSELTTFGEQDSSDIDIYQRDMNWLNESNIVVAEVTTPSLGVGYEIGQMEGKKPILCLFREQEGRRLSPMIGGNANLQVQEYKTIEDINNILDSFFKKLG